MRKRMILNALSNKTHDDLGQLQELCCFIERTLHREQRRRTADAQKKLDGVTDEYEQAFLAECYAEEIFEVERDFPRIQRYSLFVNAMSITEAGVVALCRAAERIFDLEKGINETAPGVIKAGTTFLHKNVGFHLVKNQHYVSLIEELRKVRNCITHSGGSLRGRKDADDIRTFVAGIPTAEIDSHDYLILHKGFVENMTHEMNTLLNRLCEAVSNKIRELPTGRNPRRKSGSVL